MKHVIAISLYFITSVNVIYSRSYYLVSQKTFSLHMSNNEVKLPYKRIAVEYVMWSSLKMLKAGLDL